MSRVLVTGGLGFVGSYTVDKLVTRGYKVRIIDNLERHVHHGRVPSYRNAKAEYMRDDIRRKSSLLKALNDVDYVIHLAAAVGVGQSFWEARKYMNTNAGATAALYECILCDSKLRKSVKKIVVASSKSIYGEGSYKCSSHGILNPSASPDEQLKRRESEPK